MGSRAHAVRGGEPAQAQGPSPPSEATFHVPRASLSIRGSGRRGLHHCLPPSPLCTGRSRFPLQVVGPLVDGLSFGLGPAGSREEQPSHQALFDESRPQAWLQGGTPALPYRATSRALI
ncbi:hypothetical protein CHARACLAT_024381 [Characodon lateralis]|uniref:Uncharacterized protein n=1 Tax=Characodon lateralis TaxID=208331 RepID=A0ABU7EWV6_9TELE|nr:hypothetical protein [Characodon lateralis]